MAQRITRVTTKGGDGGETSLASGERVPKTDARIEALGAIDELNSHLGLLRTLVDDAELEKIFGDLQQELFDYGAVLAHRTGNVTEVPDAERLTDLVTAENANLPPLKEFVVPGGTTASAQCHVARTVCRRAERRVAVLKVPEMTAYLNRLADVLFVLSRKLARVDDVGEEQWQPRRSKGKGKGKRPHKR